MHQDAVADLASLAYTNRMNMKVMVQVFEKDCVRFRWMRITKNDLDILVLKSIALFEGEIYFRGREVILLVRPTSFWRSSNSSRKRSD